MIREWHTVAVRPTRSAADRVLDNLRAGGWRANARSVSATAWEVACFCDADEAITLRDALRRYAASAEAGR